MIMPPPSFCSVTGNLNALWPTICPRTPPGKALNERLRSIRSCRARGYLRMESYRSRIDYRSRGGGDNGGTVLRPEIRAAVRSGCR